MSMSDLWQTLKKRQAAAAAGGSGGGSAAEFDIEPESNYDSYDTYEPSYEEPDDARSTSTYSSSDEGQQYVPNSDWKVTEPISLSNEALEEGSTRGSKKRKKDDTPDLPIKQPCAYREIEWEGIEAEEEKSSLPNYCFICDVALTDQQHQYDTRLRNLMQMVNLCITEVDPLIFTQKVQEFYNMFLRKQTRWVKKHPVTGEAMRDPHDHSRFIKYNPNLPWRRRIIYEHFTQHSPTVHIMVEESCREMTDALRCLSRNGIYEKDPVTGNIEVNCQKMAIFLKLVKERRPLLQQLEKFRSSMQKVTL